jgi:tetratricopeptide (TPR) repeat protein
MRWLPDIQKRPWIWLLVGACVISYSNGLTGGFTYDDKAIVRDDPRIQSWKHLPEIFTTHYFGGPLATGTAYRPVDLLSLAANFAVHGKYTFGYHLTNLALHVVVVLLLFLLLRRRFGEGIAGGAALLFAVMPVHVEAVTSIVGRAEVLSAALTLAALAAAVRARRAWSLPAYAGACLCYLLAIFSKESAVVFPGLLMLYEMAQGEGGFGGRFVRELRGRVAFYFGFAVPLLATFAARYAVLRGVLISKYAGVFELENPLVSLKPFARIGNASALLVRQLGRIVFPLYLSADESAWQLPRLSPASPFFWLSLLAVGALAASGMLLYRRRPALGFGILFFLLATLPTSNLLFITGTILAERLMYLPSAGIALVLAAVLVDRSSAFHRDRAAAALALLSIVYSCRTIVRNSVWQSDETLFGNLLETSPDSAKAHYDYAYMAADRKRSQSAYRHYRIATGIYSGYYDAWAGRGRLAGELGDLAEGVSSARRSTDIFPTYENGWYTLAVCAERRGDLALADRAYRDGAKNCPKSYPLAYHRAAFLWRRGRAEEAVVAYRQADSLSPDMALNHEDLGRIFAARGDSEQAEEEWDQAVALFDNSGVALAGLARLAEERKDFEEAANLRLRLFEAGRNREDLLLLLADCARSPEGKAKAAGKWVDWSRRQPALFGSPDIASRKASLDAR